jgi:hypothetical protein
MAMALRKLADTGEVADARVRPDALEEAPISGDEWTVKLHCQGKE